jgi:hypothetical protein
MFPYSLLLLIIEMPYSSIRVRKNYSLVSSLKPSFYCFFCLKGEKFDWALTLSIGVFDASAGINEELLL